MSISLYLRAREASLKPTAKAVLTALCFIADDAGANIYPSISTLARWTSLSERGIRNALGELDRLHYISRPDREQRCGGKQTVHYEINTEALPAPRPPARGAPLQDVQPPLHHVQPTPAPRSMTPAPRAANRQERPDRPERPAPDNSSGNGTDYSTRSTEDLEIIVRSFTRGEKTAPAGVLTELQRRMNG